jgi:hypothetical protein
MQPVSFPLYSGQFRYMDRSATYRHNPYALAPNQDLEVQSAAQSVFRTSQRSHGNFEYSVCPLQGDPELQVETLSENLLKVAHDHDWVFLREMLQCHSQKIRLISPRKVHDIIRICDAGNQFDLARDFYDYSSQAALPTAAFLVATQKTHQFDLAKSVFNKACLPENGDRMLSPEVFTRYVRVLQHHYQVNPSGVTVSDFRDVVSKVLAWRQLSREFVDACLHSLAPFSDTEEGIEAIEYVYHGLQHPPGRLIQLYHCIVKGDRAFKKNGT